MDEQAKFEGWAIVELFGHAREAGHITTAYFGTAAMFRVDVPDLPEREVTLLRPEYIDQGKECVMCPAGSKIMRAAVPGRTRFVSPGAIYAMNPCDEAAVFKALESMVHRDVKIIELAPRPNQLTTTLPGEDAEQDPDNYGEGPEEPEEDEDDELPLVAAATDPVHYS
jgi:hypothetical protein